MMPPGARRHAAARAPHRRRRGRRRAPDTGSRPVPTSRSRLRAHVRGGRRPRRIGPARRPPPPRARSPHAWSAPGRGCAASIRASNAGPGRSTSCTPRTTSARRTQAGSVVSVYDLGFIRFPGAVHTPTRSSTGGSCGGRWTAARWCTPRASSSPARCGEHFAVADRAHRARSRGRPPSAGRRRGPADARSPAPTATCSRRHHRAAQEPPRARAGVRRAGADATPSSRSSSRAPPAGARSEFQAAWTAAKHADRVVRLGYVSRRGSPGPARGRPCARLPLASTRASGSRRSRRWPPACRWSPPGPAPLPEAVGDAALLVDPDDVDALADALRSGGARRRPPPRPRRPRLPRVSSNTAGRTSHPGSWTCTGRWHEGRGHREQRLRREPPGPLSPEPRRRRRHDRPHRHPAGRRHRLRPRSARCSGRRGRRPCTTWPP